LQSGQFNIIVIIFVLLFSIIVGLIGFKTPPPAIVIFLVLAIFLIAFLRTDFALMILIFSMLFSPEFQFGAIGKRAIVLRMDDVFLLFVFLGWLAKMAFNKELGLLKTTPVHKPILIYALVCIISTVFGILRNYAKFQVSIFYLLKYFEYYLLFFIVTNNLKDKNQAKTFIFSLISVAFMISVYGCIMHFRGVERVSAPFEGKSGEANTMGGYLVMMIAIASGLVFNSKLFKEKLFLVIFLMFAFPALVFTLSRGSWLAFVPTMVTLIIFTRKGRKALLVCSLIIAILSPVILPKFFYERVKVTFKYGQQYQVMGKKFKLEDSAAIRVITFRYAVQKFFKEPFLGYGVGSFLPVIDNQYARIIVEVGLIGVLVFFWIIIALFKKARSNLIALKDDDLGSGLIAGFMAGLVGLLVHGISAETFILIRIMEPFWFLAAIAMVVPELRAPAQNEKLNGVSN